MSVRALAALLAVLCGLVLGCESFGAAGPGSGSKCVEGDDSHECEEATS